MKQAKEPVRCEVCGVVIGVAGNPIYQPVVLRSGSTIHYGPGRFCVRCLGGDWRVLNEG